MISARVSVIKNFRLNFFFTQSKNLKHRKGAKVDDFNEYKGKG